MACEIEVIAVNEEPESSQKGNFNDIPADVLKRILKYLSFSEIAKLRLVSKTFDKVCGDLLNFEFNRLKDEVQMRYNVVKGLMPRRESSRRKHALSRQNDIIETLQMRLALLNITIGRHVERNHCCFFAGEVLDEAKKLVRYIRNTGYLNRPFKVTDELFDLTTMAVEYFKDHIEPALPEIVYFADSTGNILSVTGTRKNSTCPSNESNKTVTENDADLPESSINELNTCLEKTRRIINRNRRNITNIKSTLRSLYENIDNLESIVHQIKKEQKDCKEIVLPQNCLNNLFLQLNHCNFLIDLLESRLLCNQKIKKSSSAVKKIPKYDSKTSNSVDSELVACDTASNDSEFQCNGSTISPCLVPKSNNIFSEDNKEKILDLPTANSQASEISNKRKENVNFPDIVYKKKKEN